MASFSADSERVPGLEVLFSVMGEVACDARDSVVASGTMNWL